MKKTPHTGRSATRAPRRQASTATAAGKRGRSAGAGSLSLDQALIALCIGAMNANDHVAPSEAARAHHLIWSTRRFRRKSGETVGSLIEDMRALVEDSDPHVVVERAARAIPARLRPPAFALLADLLLADGTLEPRERRFLRDLGAALKLHPEQAARIVEVVVLKNRL